MSTITLNPSLKMPQTSFTTPTLYTPRPLLSLTTHKPQQLISAVRLRASYLNRTSHQCEVLNPIKLKRVSLSSTIVSCIGQSSSEWGDQESGAPNAVVVEGELEQDEGVTWGSEGQVSGFNGGEDGEEGGESEGFSEPPEEAKLFVGNLPYDVDSEKLANIFDGAGIVEIAEVIYNRETDRSRGFGFVTMSTVEEAEKAVEMLNGYELNGRLLTVNKAAPRGSRPERPPREFSPSCRMYVGNLPWDLDSARLEQVFSEFGKVLSARVVSDRDTGRSRGFGFVTMSSESEVNDAIAALDGQTLDGRAVRVNVAEERPRRSF